MLKPSVLKITIQYDCPECETRSYEFSLNQVKNKKYYHCDMCGHTTKLKPVKGLEYYSAKTAKPQKKKIPDNVVKTLVTLGYQKKNIGQIAETLDLSNLSNAQMVRSFVERLS